MSTVLNPTTLGIATRQLQRLVKGVEAKGIQAAKEITQEQKDTFLQLAKQSIELVEKTEAAAPKGKLTQLWEATLKTFDTIAKPFKYIYEKIKPMFTKQAAETAKTGEASTQATTEAA